MVALTLLTVSTIYYKLNIKKHKEILLLYISKKESMYHNFNPSKNGRNRKFIGKKSGNKEVVYKDEGKYGKIATSPEDMGTYNYIAPNGVGKVGHFFLDVAPYWIFGNSPEDTTNPLERITGKNISI